MANQLSMRVLQLFPIDSFQLVFFTSLLFMPQCLSGQVTFQDVTEEQNIAWNGKTFGSSWADVTGNGLPDLFLQCHSNFFDAYFSDDLPRYYFNQGNSFEEGIILDGFSETDWHGNVLFDYDNDDDLDHLTVTGSSSINIFFENESGGFTYENSAADLGLACDVCLGRTPGIIDANIDGFLDILLNNLVDSINLMGPVLLLNQQGQSFSDQSGAYGLDWEESSFSTSADLLGDGTLNVVYLYGRPVITSLSESGFQTEIELPINNSLDFQIEDFNGDLMLDVFAVTAKKSAVVEEITPELIRGFIPFSANSGVREFSLTSSSQTPVARLFPRSLNTPYIVITGQNNVTSYMGEASDFSLDQSSPEYIGIPEFQDTITYPHIYMGYDESEENWTVRFKSGIGLETLFGFQFSGEEVAVQEVNGVNSPINLKDKMFINEGNLMFNSVLSDLFEGADNSLSVAAADFDNDMDMDIYVLRTSYAENKPNILYENMSNQSFVRHEGGWGAIGNGPGIGESVSSVDFNNDGFMDLFLTNGTSVFFLDSARVNLYENQGNDNNWIKLVLNGISSNPLGLHSKVIVYAGGVAQLRYQDGGMHRYTQDDNRLHFGLAQNSIIDSIVVDWPSGIHQVLTEVEVNQINTVVEEIDLSASTNQFGRFGVNVFPNPTTGQFTVKVPEENIVSIRIYNSVGILIKAWSYDGSSDLKKIQLVAAPGIYTMEVTCTRGALREKIVMANN